MPAPKRKTPARRKRTSDPNLEPGLAAATRRSQAPKKKASPQGGAAGITRGRALGAKSAPPRAELKSLQKQMKKMMEAMRPFAATPKKKAPAGPKAATPTSALKSPGRADAARSARAKRKRTADAAKTVAKRPYSRRSGMTPETDAAIQRRPVTKKRAPARPRAAAPKRAKPAASPYDTLGNQIPARRRNQIPIRRRRLSTASRKRLK